MALRTAGSDPPGTLGGCGWVTRVGSHAEDVEAGALWTRCGYRLLTATVREDDRVSVG